MIVSKLKTAKGGSDAVQKFFMVLNRIFDLELARMVTPNKVRALPPILMIEAARAGDAEAVEGTTRAT